MNHAIQSTLAHQLVASTTTKKYGSDIPYVETEPSFNLKLITDTIIPQEKQEIIAKFIKIIKQNPTLFNWNDYNLNMFEFRKLTKERIIKLARSGVYHNSDYLNNPLKLVYLSCALNLFDMSLSTRVGVQYALFGGTLASLGSKRHEKYFDGISNFDIPGCFCMTELNHGSNVRGIETTAKWDQSSRSFIINTPTDSAQKIWIGNALTATYSVVFAKLTDGKNKDCGVNVFLVPVRDEKTRELLNGVYVADNRKKVGMNGIDNGRFWFKNVKIPHEAHLDKYGSVDPETGIFSSPIPSNGKRFAKIVSALVSGRVMIANSTLTASVLFLEATLRYLTSRKQFGPFGVLERSIFEYQTLQLKLVPLLARHLTYSYGVLQLNKLYQNRFKSENKQLHVLASGYKSRISALAVQIMQECREACGGVGYDARNRFGKSHADCDITKTYEGTNSILLQQVTKSLLSDFASEIRKKGMFHVLQKRFEASVSSKNVVVRRIWSRRHLHSYEFLHSALLYRRNSLVYALGRKLNGLVRKKKINSFDAWNMCLDLVIQVAHSHIALDAFEQLSRYISRLTNQVARSNSNWKRNTVPWRTNIEVEGGTDRYDQSLKTYYKKTRIPPTKRLFPKPNADAQTIVVLTHVRDLFALDHITKHLGWYMVRRFLKSEKATALQQEYLKEVKEVGYYSLSLCKSYNNPSYLLDAFPLLNWEKSNPFKGYWSNPDAIPIDDENL